MLTMRNLVQIILLYLCGSNAVFLRNGSQIFESSASGSGFFQENVDEQNIPLSTTETIVHEISGSILLDTKNGEKEDNNPTSILKTDPTEVASTASPCGEEGNCGITLQPVPTRVMDIDLDTDVSADGATYKIWERLDEEWKTKFEAWEEMQNEKQRINEKYLSEILLKLGAFQAEKESSGSSGSIDDLLEEKLSILETMISNVVAKVGELEIKLMSSISNKNREIDSDKDMLKNIMYILEEMKNLQKDRVSTTTTSRGAFSPITEVWSTNTPSIASANEVTNGMYEAGLQNWNDNLDLKLKQAREETVRNIKESQRDFVDQIKSVVSKCSTEGIQESDDDIDGTNTDEPVTIPHQNTHSQDSVTTASSIQSPATESSNINGIKYPKVMLCKSCCEEVALSELLARQKQQTSNFAYETNEFETDERDSTSYEVVAKAKSFIKVIQENQSEIDEYTKETIQNTNPTEAEEPTPQYITEANEVSSMPTTRTASVSSPTTISPVSITKEEMVYPEQVMIMSSPDTSPATTTEKNTASSNQDAKNLTSPTEIPQFENLQTTTESSNVTQRFILEGESLDDSDDNLNLNISKIPKMNETSMYTFLSDLYETNSSSSTLPSSIMEQPEEEDLKYEEPKSLSNFKTTTPLTVSENSTTIVKTAGTPKPSKHVIPKHCAELYRLGERKSGVYRISPLGRGSWKVYCDMDTDGGGWTVIQRRMDGTVNFSRNWNDYINGFGQVSGEYWLGLDRMHLLTANAKYKTRMSLRIDLIDWDDVSQFAQFNACRIGSAQKKYKLLVKQYHGTAGNALQYGKNYNHNQQEFTTFDNDNDKYAKGNCGNYYQSGWWFNACFAANLNGKFYNGTYSGIQDGIYWGTWYKLNDANNARYSFKYADMKLRPANFATHLRRRKHVPSTASSKFWTFG